MQKCGNLAGYSCKMINKTSMEYWYPKIKDLPIPQPKTDITLHKDYNEWWSCLDGVPLSPKDIQTLEDAGDRMGYPLFLRTDLCSGKHMYLDTCFVPKKEDLSAHVFRLIDNNCCKDQAFTSFVFREFIELAWQFKAFNGLPIAPERRYFIEDGDVTEHFPYWPHDAIRNPDNTHWESALRNMNYETSEEIIQLTEYAEMVSRTLPGYWSVDFAKARDGIWYLIDMAEGDKSWKPIH